MNNKWDGILTDGTPVEKYPDRLGQACEYLRKYQQRYHGAEHARKLWNEVNQFLSQKGGE